MVKKKKRNCEYELLYSEVNPNVTKLHEIYKDDPWKARVFFMDKGKDCYLTYRLGYFDRGNGEFSIAYFRKQYGISKTNRMYSSERQVFSLVHTNGKYHTTFSIFSKKQVRLASVEQLSQLPTDIVKLVIDKLRPKLPWLRLLGEHNIMHDIPFNTIIKHKLFDYDSALKYMYKVPIKTAHMIHSCENYNIRRNLKHYWQYTTNVGELNPELIENGGAIDLFYETLKLAKVTGFHVDCRWGIVELQTANIALNMQVEETLFTTTDTEFEIDHLFLEYQKKINHEIITNQTRIYNLLRNEGHPLRHTMQSLREKRWCVFTSDGFVYILRNDFTNLCLHKTYGDKKLMKVFLENRIKEVIHEIKMEKEVKEEVDMDGIFSVLQDTPW